MTSTRSFAYDNLVHSFDQPWVSAFYVFAMLVLALHLSHGLWTAVNDLGTTGRRVTPGGAGRRGCRSAGRSGRQHLTANRSSDWSGFMTHYLLDDLRKIGSRVDRGLASQLELVDDPTDRSLTSDEPH